MAVFKPETEWRGRGAPRIDIPQVLMDILDKTYQTGTFYQIQVDGEKDPGTIELIRASRVYCARQGKKIHYQFLLEGVEVYIRLKMRDARTYVRKEGTQ